MPIEYAMMAKCDQCGEVIEPAVKVLPSQINSQRWEWQRKWKEEGTMQGLPNLYGKKKLYCANCAGS